uniref:uncharacterized protein LOC120348035 isoform X2 n=1 Tax=Styela clava TaxID=7725 RepID=UPI001939C5CE|nr:uncharacterized protein LOC120348035 isoform X2 [Styela clava]
MMQKFLVSLLLSAAVMSMLLGQAYGIDIWTYPECTEDTDCRPKEYCDIFTNGCDDKECEDDDECGPKQFCHAGWFDCYDKECEKDDDCERGEFCDFKYECSSEEWQWY